MLVVGLAILSAVGNLELSVPHFFFGWLLALITLKVVDYCLPQGGSHMKGVRMLVTNFELNP